VMMQVSDLNGPILVGLVLIAANLAIAEVIQARREGRAPGRRLVAVGVLVPAVAALYGVVRMRSVDAAAAAAKPVKIGIVQGNMPLFDRKASITVHTKRTRELRDKGAELVVWSEAAVTRAFSEDKHKEEIRSILTKGLGVPTIVGTVLRRPADKGNEESRVQYFNTALFAGEGGVIQGRYDKQYLLAFGEYLPLGSTFPILYKWSPNSGRFTPGTSIEPLPWGEHKISALICYEDILPSFVNGVVRHADPDLIVNLTNDAWFGDSTEPWIHLALSKLRAIEHRRYLVRATNSGVSAIVDPVGRVVVHSGTFREEALLGEARFMRSTTVYEIIGDIPWWIGTFVVFGMAFFTRPRPPTPEPDKPKADKPKADKPKADEPKADEPKADEPKADKPKADEPKADEPT
jgi:apolipoprotein N-acyltransferase